MKTKFHKILLSFTCMLSFAANAEALNERIVHDPNTGIALFGYDPLSYFVNLYPKLGLVKNETYIDGISWRFYSEGNRRVFEKSPQSYMPQFGGYDVVALANSKISMPDPRFYIVYKDKLFLFASAASRVTFSVEPDYFLAEAKKNWEKVKLNLATQ